MLARALPPPPLKHSDPHVPCGHVTGAQKVKMDQMQAAETDFRAAMREFVKAIIEANGGKDYFKKKGRTAANFFVEHEKVSIVARAPYSWPFPIR